MNQARQALPSVLVCALLWGSAFPGIKSVYQHWELSGVERTASVILLFSGVRFALAGFGLLLVSRHLRQQLRETPWMWIAALGLTQTVLQYIFFYRAVSISSASLAALLAGTGSFWWMLLSPAFGQSPWPKFKQWMALLIGAVGVCLAVYAPGAGSGQPVLGAVLMLAATCNGALAVLVFRKVHPTMSAKGATGLSLFFGGLVLILLGYRALPQLPELFDQRVIISTLWLAFVSAAAFSLWNYTSTRFSVPLLASYRFLIPVCGVTESLIFLTGESPGWGLIVGGILVIGSILLAQRWTVRT